MLKCSDNSIYTELTNRIDRRLEERRLDKSPECYTFKRRPLILIFHQEFMQFAVAALFEKTIKK
jgi:putative endonuclease